MDSSRAARSLLSMTWNHAEIIADMSSCLMLGFFFAASRFNLAQRFSIGFRSGLFPGHWRRDTWWELNHVKHFLAVWHGAPSCWKMNVTSCPKMSRANDKSFGSSTALIYLSPLTVPSKIWSCPTQLQDMHPHTITETGCFIVGTVVVNLLEMGPSWELCQGPCSWASVGKLSEMTKGPVRTTVIEKKSEEECNGNQTITNKHSTHVYTQLVKTVCVQRRTSTYVYHYPRYMSSLQCIMTSDKHTKAAHAQNAAVFVLILCQKWETKQKTRCHPWNWK